MYWEKLSSLVILLITVQVSIARTLYRRLDVNEFLTPSDDQNAAAQAKSAPATSGSDFEYDGIHGIGKQIQDATPVVINHLTTAAANIAVTTGGILANIAYQLLNFIRRSILCVGRGTINKLGQLRNKHKAFMTMIRDVITNSGNYVAGKLERLSDTLDDVVKISGEPNNQSRHLQEESKKKKKKKKKSTSNDDIQEENVKNPDHKDGNKKKKKVTEGDVQNNVEMKMRDVEDTKNVKNDRKKKKKRTKKVADENAKVMEPADSLSVL